MTDRERYEPGPANGAQVRKDGEKRALILVRELRRSTEKVWQALTDPEHLREWAPFDADRSVSTVGTTVKLTTVSAHAACFRNNSDASRRSQCVGVQVGGFDMRWELEAFGGGRRLTLVD